MKDIFSQPFGGINNSNYEQAINPNSNVYMINTGAQASYDQIFKPVEIKDGKNLSFIFITLMIVGVYLIFKKGD